MGKSAIDKLTPTKLKNSSRSLKNESRCTPSSKYQMQADNTVAIKILTMGKIRQQSLLFVMVQFSKVKINQQK